MSTIPWDIRRPEFITIRKFEKKPIFYWLPDAHGESVNILIQLIKEGYALDDHVVHPMNIELYFGSGIAVTQTKLGNSRSLWCKTCEKTLST